MDFIALYTYTFKIFFLDIQLSLEENMFKLFLLGWSFGSSSKGSSKGGSSGGEGESESSGYTYNDYLIPIFATSLV